MHLKFPPLAMLLATIAFVMGDMGGYRQSPRMPLRMWIAKTAKQS